MDATVSVDPFRCRLWSMHDRLEEHITEESCAEEIRSFAEHGQLIPALGRPIHDDPDHDIELVCGARRLFVARHIRMNLLVEVREISDRDAMVAMDLENRQRKDISPYERGLCYVRWLRGGYFDSQEDIARALNISPSLVSRLLKLARLPSVVVGAFGAVEAIRANWGLHLARVMENPAGRDAVIRTARTIGTVATPPAAREVYRCLMAAAAGGTKPKTTNGNKVVKGSNGVTLFRVIQRRHSVALLFPLERTPRQSLDEIEVAAVQILESAGAEKAQVGLERRENPTQKPQVQLCHVARLRSQ